MRPPRDISHESRLARVIAALMTTGIAAGVLFLIAGMILYYRTHGDFAVSTNPEVFIHGQGSLFLLYDMVRAAGRGGAGVTLLTLGIVVLMVTPFVRVVVSVVYFALVRDYRYVLITLIVLVVLTLSLTLHGNTI